MIDKTNYKNHLMFLLGCLLGVFGVIAGAGSMNWGVRGGEGWLFIVAGIICIADAIYAVYSFYVQFLKPDGSGTSNAKK